jgi:hypothetical protein
MSAAAARLEKTSYKQISFRTVANVGSTSKEGLRITPEVVLQNPAYGKWRQSDRHPHFSDERERISERI